MKKNELPSRLLHIPTVTWRGLIVIALLALHGCAIRTLPPTAPTEGPPVVRPLPPAPEAPVTALDGLLRESRARVNAGDWDAAIVTAERGLRIDRRQPELYLLLAKSYRGLADPDRASQFARQGLRYVSDDASPVAEDLRILLLLLER